MLKGKPQMSSTLVHILPRECFHSCRRQSLKTKVLKGSLTMDFPALYWGSLVDGAVSSHVAGELSRRAGEGSGSWKCSFGH